MAERDDRMARPRGFQARRVEPSAREDRRWARTPPARWSMPRRSPLCSSAPSYIHTTVSHQSSPRPAPLAGTRRRPWRISPSSKIHT